MNQIIACVDGSRVNDSVSAAAVWMASRIHSPLTFLHVLEHTDSAMNGDLSGTIGFDAREDLLSELIDLDSQRAQLELQHGKLILEAVTRRAEGLGLEVSTIQRHGGLTETLIEYEPVARAVVIGRRGEAHEGFPSAIGSHIEHVLRTLQRPVFVVAENFQEPQEFVLAFDGSQTAKKILDLVVRSPLLEGLTCHLVMIGNADKERKASYDASVEQLTLSGFSIVRAELELQGSVVETLVDYQRQKKIGLTIMGAYGHSRIRQFFVGSQTTGMLQRSLTPLLLLR